MPASGQWGGDLHSTMHVPLFFHTKPLTNTVPALKWPALPAPTTLPLPPAGAGGRRWRRRPGAAFVLPGCEMGGRKRDRGVDECSIAMHAMVVVGLLAAPAAAAAHVAC